MVNDTQINKFYQDENLFLDTMNISVKKVIPYKFSGKLIKIFSLPNNELFSLLVSLIYAIIFILFSLLINQIFSIQLNSIGLLAIIIPNLLAGLMIWIIRIVEKMIFIKNIDYYKKIPKNKKGYLEATQFFTENFKERKQLRMMIVFAVLFLFTSVILVADLKLINNNFGFFIGITNFGFWIGNGAYFAIKLPFLARTIINNGITLYPFEPGKSKIINIAMKAIGNLALGTGIAASSIMFLIIYSSPWDKNFTFYLSLVWLIFIWGLVSYTYVFPYSCLSKAIENEKITQINRINLLIDKFSQKIETLSIEELEKLQKMVELRRILLESDISPFQSSSLRKYIISMFLPAFSFFIGSFDTFQLLYKMIILNK